MGQFISRCCSASHGAANARRENRVSQQSQALRQAIAAVGNRDMPSGPPAALTSSARPIKSISTAELSKLMASPDEQLLTRQIIKWANKRLQNESWWYLAEIAQQLTSSSRKAEALFALVVAEDIGSKECKFVLAEANKIACPEDRTIVLTGVASRLGLLRGDPDYKKFLDVTAALPAEEFQCLLGSLIAARTVEALNYLKSHQLRLKEEHQATLKKEQPVIDLILANEIIKNANRPSWAL